MDIIKVPRVHRHLCTNGGSVKIWGELQPPLAPSMNIPAEKH